MVSDSAASAKAVQSNLEQLQRAEVSNPPAYGARIASTVLQDSELNAMWREEHRVMSSRLKEMRSKLLEELRRLGRSQCSILECPMLTRQNVQKISNT